MPEFILFSFLVLVFFLGVHFKSPAFKGRDGERRVNSRLQSSFADSDAQVLRNLTFPSGDGTTQVDHVVIARSGVFVIETKNMAGLIFGGANQARWTQVLHKHKSQFQNPLRQNYKHVRVVQQALSLNETQIYNVVVFAGNGRPKTDMPENVIWGARNLSRYIKAQHQIVFSQSEMQALALQLQRIALDPSKETDKLHIAHVKAEVLKRETATDNCPRCSGTLVERTARKTGRKFISCTPFPQCRYTRFD